MVKGHEHRFGKMADATQKKHGLSRQDDGDCLPDWQMKDSVDDEHRGHAASADENVIDADGREQKIALFAFVGIAAVRTAVQRQDPIAETVAFFIGTED